MLETKQVMLPFNDTLAGELEKFGREGWIITPGIMPVVIYTLCRPLGAMSPEMAAQFQAAAAAQPAPQEHHAAMAEHHGFGKLHINEDEEHFYFIDAKGRKVFRDGRPEPQPHE